MPKSFGFLVVKDLIFIMSAFLFFSFVISFKAQYISAQRDREQSAESFTSTILNDQDKIVMQLLLNSVSDLEYYFENLTKKFKLIDFCISVYDPKMSSVFSCSKVTQTEFSEINLLNNEKHKIFYRLREIDYYKTFLSALANSEFIVLLLICISLLLYIYFRVNKLLYRPLTYFSEQLLKIAAGSREMDSYKDQVLSNWSQTHFALKSMIEYLKSLELIFEQKTKIEVAKKIAHDIRSPLTALSAIVSTADNLRPEQRSLIVSAFDRISNIANEILIDSTSASLSEEKKFNVYSAIRDIVLEKSIEHSAHLIKITISGHIKNLHLKDVDVFEFKRVMSNILNNSIESNVNKMPIEVMITFDNALKITISDRGCGIDADILNSLGTSKVSTKERGTGIGLYSAFRYVRSWGGNLKISSQVGIGTEVILEFNASHVFIPAASNANP